MHLRNSYLRVGDLSQKHKKSLTNKQNNYIVNNKRSRFVKVAPNLNLTHKSSLYLTPPEGHITYPVILHLFPCLSTSLVHCSFLLSVSLFLCFNRWEFWVSFSSVWGDSMPYFLQAPSETPQAQPLWDSSSSATEAARGASESGWSGQKGRGSLIWKLSTPPCLPLWESF